MYKSMTSSQGKSLMLRTFPHHIRYIGTLRATAESATREYTLLYMLRLYDEGKEKPDRSANITLHADTDTDSSAMEITAISNSRALINLVLFTFCTCQSF
jgi:hypothetical protein